MGATSCIALKIAGRRIVPGTRAGRTGEFIRIKKLSMRNSFMSNTPTLKNGNFLTSTMTLYKWITSLTNTKTLSRKCQPTMKSGGRQFTLMWKLNDCGHCYVVKKLRERKMESGKFTRIRYEITPIFPMTAPSNIPLKKQIPSSISRSNQNPHCYYSPSLVALERRAVIDIWNWWRCLIFRCPWASSKKDIVRWNRS